MTEWRAIKGFEGKYEVSSDGRVRSLNYMRRGYPKELIPNIIHGYERVMLYEKSKYKCFSVHRLVAMTFIPNPNNYPCINHKDENKQNNNVDNLEWCTQYYNVHYGSGLQRLSNKAKKKPLEQLKDGVVVKRWESISEAMRAGYTWSSISKVIKGKWTHYKGYQWQYAI